jgi:hypothetical protein
VDAIEGELTGHHTYLKLDDVHCGNGGLKRTQSEQKTCFFCFCFSEFEFQAPPAGFNLGDD